MDWPGSFCFVQLGLFGNLDVNDGVAHQFADGFGDSQAFCGVGVQTDAADRGGSGLHGAQGVGAVFYFHRKFEGSGIFADGHIFISFPV